MAKNNQALTTDFELSQIVLVPTSDWDSSLLGLGNRYDVYDGQQRLVTLNLLLAGLRDSFQCEADDLCDVGTGVGEGASKGGKRAVALAATALEISSMLVPTKVRKEDVVRITLRKRDNVLLEKILMGEGGSSQGLEETDGEVAPTQPFSKMTQKQLSELLSPLSMANTRILQNFLHMTDRLSLLTTRERLRLLDYIVERVYLLVCIPETSRIARNIVMSQGRKGMDNEPIDDFKGLVCFRYTLQEEDMYQTFDEWDALAAEPSTSILNGEASTEESSKTTAVGRDTISSACLLRASAALRTKIRSRGGDEVYEWERWLRQELWLENHRLSHQQQQKKSKQTQSDVQPWQGKDFFTREIEPAAIALHKFRNGQFDEFNFLSQKGKQKLDSKKRDTVIAGLNFLRDVTTAVSSAKEAEIVVLELLLRAEKEVAGDGTMLSRYIDEFLPLIEAWTLWMAVARPSPMQRHARVFALLDAMDDFDSVVGASFVDEDVKSLKGSIDEYKFGATVGGKKLATALLKRLNAYMMLHLGDTIPENIDATAAELILPEKISKGSDWERIWHEVDRSQEENDQQLYCIGNMALVSTQPTGKGSAKKGGKKTKKADAASWEHKKQSYAKEPWPLTFQLGEPLGESSEWDGGAISDRQIQVLDLVGHAMLSSKDD